MKRKIANISLALILLITSTGMTWHYHYCCNVLMKVSFLHTPKPCCEHPEDCCRDKAVTYQLKVDYLTVIDLIDFTVLVADQPPVTTIVCEPLVTDSKNPVTPSESPPPELGMRLAMLQQYLI